MTLNAKIEVLWIFWQFLAVRHISIANCTEITIEIDRDSLRMKLSALSVVFASLNFTPSCIQGILCTGASNLGTPFKILTIGHSNSSSHIRRWCRLVYVNASYPTSVAGIGEHRYCTQRTFKHAPLSRVSLCVCWVSCYR